MTDKSEFDINPAWIAEMYSTASMCEKATLGMPRPTCLAEPTMKFTVPEGAYTADAAGTRSSGLAGIGVVGASGKSTEGVGGAAQTGVPLKSGGEGRVREVGVLRGGVVAVALGCLLL